MENLQKDASSENLKDINSQKALVFTSRFRGNFCQSLLSNLVNFAFAMWEKLPEY